MFDGSDEKSPHEPDEFDPNSLGPDIPDPSTSADNIGHESDNFDPNSPGPDIPEPSANAGNVDSEVRGLFWVLVFVANIALMATSLGVMFAVFREQWIFGSQLTVVGLILGGYVYYRVRKFQAE